MNKNSFHEEFQYLNELKNILNNGNKKNDRTGTGTISLFGSQMRFNLQNSFPLITTKKIHFKSVVHELLWFISGNTNIKYLKENNVRIWDEWADENGDLGPVYGHQWRKWGERKINIEKSKEDDFPDIVIHNGLDQLKEVIDSINNNPDSRRHIVSAWNPSDISNMALPPCHILYQFYVHDGKLSCQLYQRSCDMFLGVPFNIASYSLLTMMIAKHCGLEPYEFIWTGGDVHIYSNHIDQVNEQLSREPLDFPKVKINSNNIFDIKYEDIELIDYNCHPAIKAKVAV